MTSKILKLPRLLARSYSRWNRSRCRLCDRGNYLSTPALRLLTHQSIVKNTVHLWQNGKTAKENLELVDYRRGGFVPSIPLGWSDTIDNITSLVTLAKVYTDFLGKQETLKSIFSQETLCKIPSHVHMQQGVPVCHYRYIGVAFVEILMWIAISI